MSQVADGSKKVDPLRQQLDELDQLMEKMLALGAQPAQSQSASESVQNPVLDITAVEGSQDPISEQVNNESPVNPFEFASAAAAAHLPEFNLTNVAVDLGAAPTVQDPLPQPEPPPELPLPAPTFVSLEASAEMPAPPVFADFQFAPPPSMPVLERAEMPIVTTAPAPIEPIVFVAWWLRPLALVNRVYDGSTGWLGPIGRGLRSRPMRSFLGFCGLACILGALAWVLWEGTDWNS